MTVDVTIETKVTARVRPPALVVIDEDERTE
jgi:hypothetical protein